MSQWSVCDKLLQYVLLCVLLCHCFGLTASQLLSPSSSSSLFSPPSAAASSSLSALDPSSLQKRSKCLSSTHSSSALAAPSWCVTSSHYLVTSKSIEWKRMELGILCHISELLAQNGTRLKPLQCDTLWLTSNFNQRLSIILCTRMQFVLWTLSSNETI